MLTGIILSGAWPNVNDFRISIRFPEGSRPGNVYPGGCLIEGTQLSEGRGTTLPFELVGAPWIDARALADRMRHARLPGVVFREASFRPEFQKHAKRPCGGVQVIVQDPDSFGPFTTYLCLIREARALDPEVFDWRSEPYEFESERLAIDLLLGRTELRPMLESSVELHEIVASWSEGLREFRRLRQSFLLYS